jgi:hypothetical protein
VSYRLLDANNAELKTGSINVEYHCHEPEVRGQAGERIVASPCGARAKRELNLEYNWWIG